MEEATSFAKKYLEDLLSFFGLNTEVSADCQDEVIQLAVPSSELNGFLIGAKAETLYALQQITTAALRTSKQVDYRVNVDVAGYKQQKADKLTAEAEVWIAEVISSSQQKALLPMNAAERRIIHQLATEKGLMTESMGTGPERHVVLKPGA